MGLLKGLSENQTVALLSAIAAPPAIYMATRAGQRSRKKRLDKQASIYSHEMSKIAAHPALAKIWKQVRRHAKASRHVADPKVWKTLWGQAMTRHGGDKAKALLDTTKAMKMPLTGATGVLGTGVVAKGLYNKASRGSGPAERNYGGGGYAPPY